MKLGMFDQAYHPSGKPPYDWHGWDLQSVRTMDEGDAWSLDTVTAFDSQLRALPLPTNVATYESVSASS